MPQAAKHPKLPKHCQWWKGSIRVHIGVPKPLQAAVGKTALLRALGTKCAREAEYLRLPVVKEFETIIETARLAVNPANVAPRITAQLSYRYPTERGLFGIAGALARLPAGVDQAAVMALVDQRLDAFHQRNGQVAAAMRSFEDRLPESFDNDRILDALPLADASEVIPFAFVLDAWATRQSNPETKEDYRAKLAAFAAFRAGASHPRGMSEEQKTAYLANADAAAVTVDDAVAYLDELAAKKSAKTADNHFAALKAVWGFNAQPGRKLFKAGSPFAQIKTGLKSDPKEGRQIFEEAERDALLKAANESNDPVEKFVMLIAGFSGARVSEIVEAHPRDVGELDGVPVLRIRSTYRGQNRGLKTAESERILPLHPAVAPGFLAHAESRKGSDELFPSLKPDKNNGLTDDASDKLNKFIRRVLGYNDKRKVFHSWRHTVATMLKNLRPRVPEEMRFYITGHATEKGEGHGYIHGEELSAEEVRELAEVIERLSNPL